MCTKLHFHVCWVNIYKRKYKRKRSQVTLAEQPASSIAAAPSTNTTRREKRTPPVLNIRTSPNGLYNLVQQLSEDQKAAVRAIGFGSLLSLGVSRIPFHMCRHLLRNFNARRCSLILSNGGELLIDQEDIQCVLNLPRGGVEVTESIGKPGDGPDYMEFVRDWKTRWVNRKDNRGAPLTGSMPNKIIANRAADDDFKRDFVVYVVSSFLWGTQGSMCRFRILKSLIDVDSIKDLNWCKFTLDGLVDSVRKWQAKTESYFHGPLTFLMLFYMDRVAEYTVRPQCNRVFPILSCWDDKMVSERRALEEENGGYCRGRVLARIPLPQSFPAIDCIPLAITDKSTTERDVETSRAAEELLNDACQHFQEISTQSRLSNSPFPFESCIQSFVDTTKKLKALYKRSQFDPSPTSKTTQSVPSTTPPTEPAIPSTTPLTEAAIPFTIPPTESAIPSTLPHTQPANPTGSSPRSSTQHCVPSVSSPTSSNQHSVPSATSPTPMKETESEGPRTPISQQVEEPNDSDLLIHYLSKKRITKKRTVRKGKKSTLPQLEIPAVVPVPIAVEIPTVNIHAPSDMGKKSSLPQLEIPAVVHVPIAVEIPAVNIPAPSDRQRRKWLKVPKSLCSPYLLEIRGHIGSGLMKEHLKTADFVFADGLDEAEILYTNESCTLKRRALRTMARGEWVDAAIIDAFAHEMNRYAQNEILQPRRRLFFSTLHSSCVLASQEIYNDSVMEELRVFMINPDNISKADLIFLPISWSQHFYVVVYNISAEEVQILDNRTLPPGILFCNKYKVVKQVVEKFVSFLSLFDKSFAKKLSRFRTKLVEMPWQDNRNKIDCGVYCMRHMHTYMGDPDHWSCGINKSNASEKLHSLRIEYLGRILNSPNNTLKDMVQYTIGQYERRYVRKN